MINTSTGLLARLYLGCGSLRDILARNTQALRQSPGSPYAEGGQGQGLEPV